MSAIDFGLSLAKLYLAYRNGTLDLQALNPLNIDRSQYGGQLYGGRTEVDDTELRRQALCEVRDKVGAVTVLIGSRETGKTILSQRWAEALGRQTYAVAPEQRPPPWIIPVKFGDALKTVPPMSTLIYDDLPAYASNRDYNTKLVTELEAIVPMCRHERKLQLIFCTQSAAQADKYILDCDLAFLKPLGILMQDVERPFIRRIYRLWVDPAFDQQPAEWIQRHAYMISRSYRGVIPIVMAK